MSLTSVVAAPIAGRLVSRLGVRTTAASGLALSAAGLLLTRGMSPEGGLSLVLSGMVVGEAGFMLSNVALTIAGSGGAGEDRKGLSAGLLNTSIQLGNAWSLGIVATVVAAATVGGQAAAGPEALVGGCGGGSWPAWASQSWPFRSFWPDCAAKRLRQSRLSSPAHAPEVCGPASEG
jgi:hypothetical protein